MGSNQQLKLLPWVGGAFVALAVVALLVDQPALSGTFGLLALLAFLAAAFFPRIQGEVSAGIQGFKFSVVQEVARGAPAAGLTRDQLVAAIEAAGRLDAASVQASMKELGGPSATPQMVPEEHTPPQDGEILLSDAGVIEIIAEQVIASAKEHDKP